MAIDTINKRTKVVQVRLTEAEKNEIKKEASDAHLTLASYIRFKLLSEAKVNN